MAMKDSLHVLGTDLWRERKCSSVIIIPSCRALFIHVLEVETEPRTLCSIHIFCSQVSSKLHANN